MQNGLASANAGQTAGRRGWGLRHKSRAMPDGIAARARLCTSDLFMPWGRPR
jgi:hypothetical protein